MLTTHQKLLQLPDPVAMDTAAAVSSRAMVIRALQEKDLYC